MGNHSGVSLFKQVSSLTAYRYDSEVRKEREEKIYKEFISESHTKSRRAFEVDLVFVQAFQSIVEVMGRSQTEVQP